MKRREFINWVGLGAIASYLPVALVACSSTNADNTNTEVTTSSEAELLSMGTVEQLNEAGYLLNEESKVMVVKDSEDKLLAVNPTCTHQGCIVDWEADSNTLVCPCHNAKYAPDGKVLATPAQEPLSTYEVQSENGEILVRLV